jgi:hypothetical protein
MPESGYAPLKDASNISQLPVMFALKREPIATGFFSLSHRGEV